MKRLTSLNSVTGAAQLPGYDPDAHGRGIVHLGIGAFHRAHQAVMTDDALAASGGDWRITGVSLRSLDLAEALNAQHGLYTLIERGAQGTHARVIASIRDLIAADPAATLAALCAPEIRIVTLTVTEKGYGFDRIKGGPDLNHPAVSADLASPNAPSGVLGLLVRALAQRRQSGQAPFSVLSCDNLPDNGRLLRSGVVGLARIWDPGLADWIETEVAFPSSMVDRITPATTSQTLSDAARLTGCIDLAAVETEPFLQWVIEDRFPTGRPAWEAGGALFVKDVAPYEQMKLTMLNGSHSMLAYAGFLSGRRYVRDVMEDPALARLVRRHLETAATLLPVLSGINLHDYARSLEARFRNPAIAHETRQIAMDGTQKLPQRIFKPALLAIERNLPLNTFAFATAAWMRYAIGRDDNGEPYAISDPREAEITTALRNIPYEAQAIIAALNALPGLIPPALSQHPRWSTAVERALERMLTDGMIRAIGHEAKE
ncbi:mannitol dehydrogenase family protein [Shinella sumterensis]|uniref:mannitol dehydrogenase family protein n=1 Tax=Shinella sumterensis TaxID=1967501 RepID=UPI003F85F63C